VVNNLGAGLEGRIGGGITEFNQDGTINLANTDLGFGAASAPGVFDFTLASSGTPAAANAPAWAASLGIDDQTITLDLSKISQYAATSTVNAISSNGAGVGNIVAIEVSEEGIVSAIYDNSQIRQIAKVGIATFPNADSLAQVSGNAYRRTDDAGEMTIKEAGVGGAGLISPSSLEASTVDLSAEFTGLIQTQKAYSASSKIITTADQMLEELINIKR
jgi:flagellar hook protein FlgE